MKTQTPVHDPRSAQMQRQAERAQAGGILTATMLAAQGLSFGALYLLSAVSTASWWAALMTLPAAAALYALSWAANRLKGAEDALPDRLAAGVCALLCFSDMAVDLMALIELSHVFILPQAPRWGLTLAAALTLAFALPPRRPAALYAARFLRGFLLLAFAFCAATVLPAGETGYLYPLAGYGVKHTLKGAALMCGSVWMAALPPHLAPQAEASARRAGHALRPLLLADALLALLFLCCVYVLPGPALSAGWGYALRLQMLMEMSPNTLSWSLMLIAEMLLFLTAFSASATVLRGSLQRALPARTLPLWPFALLCAPLALRGADASQALLLWALPARYPLTAALLLLLLIARALAKKKGRSP